MIHRGWLYGGAAAALLVLVAASLVFARSSQTSVCQDPTSPCWTRGRPAYEAVTEMTGFGVQPGWRVPPTASFRLLNTGPNIPHLVAVVNPHGSRTFRAVYATINSGYGPRHIRVHRLSPPHPFVAWDLGPIPDGAVVRLVLHSSPIPQRYPHWVWAQVYGDVTVHGQPDWSYPVRPEQASLRP